MMKQLHQLYVEDIVLSQTDHKPLEAIFQNLIDSAPVCL